MTDFIEIWQPRYHDNVVLVAKRKVRTGWNYIKFTKDPKLKATYRITGEAVRKCPLETNGRIPCYAVPMEALEQT